MTQGVFTGMARGSQQSSGHLSDILARIKDYSAAFSDKAQTIVHALQAHPDLDCRFLGIRLSFSDFYKTKKEQAHSKAS